MELIKFLETVETTLTPEQQVDFAKALAEVNKKLSNKTVFKECIGYLERISSKIKLKYKL